MVIAKTVLDLASPTTVSDLVCVCVCECLGAG